MQRPKSIRRGRSRKVSVTIAKAGFLWKVLTSGIQRQVVDAALLRIKSNIQWNCIGQRTLLVDHPLGNLLLKLTFSLGGSTLVHVIKEAC